MLKNGKEKVYLLGDKTYHCGIDVTMNFIGGKWKCVVLWYLKNGTQRFSELKALIPDITEKGLSIQLTALTENGLVERKAYGLKPPIRVEYSLTEFGKSLIHVIDNINDWGKELGSEKGTLIEKV
ncbi:transcriptional regulator [Flagellimonas aquimarina]|uniref:Transcriptional regulator n=1 Tax=Flagellimonas aquimarina TaxID=2201895 RepID=A0A316KXR2_9FLAO|nr:helix-turn-helix domain-containing protein [Allomuricauda koreensis]PWL37529.1 transcriptional regulator [Allomuricauda koreensis]